jgi:hypothetical protein
MLKPVRGSAESRRESHHDFESMLLQFKQQAQETKNIREEILLEREFAQDAEKKSSEQAFQRH